MINIEATPQGFYLFIYFSIYTSTDLATTQWLILKALHISLESIVQTKYGERSYILRNDAKFSQFVFFGFIRVSVKTLLE